MSIQNPYVGRTEEQINEIQHILKKDIPERVKDRNFGFGENWSMEKEEELQDWLDEISNKYDFDFRLLYSSVESLWFDDYQKGKIYG